MEKSNIYIQRKFVVPSIRIFEGSCSTSNISTPKSISSIQSEYNISSSMNTISNRNSIKNLPLFEENITRKSPSSIQSDYSFDFSSIGSSIQEDDSIFNSIFQVDIDEVAENVYKK